MREEKSPHTCKATHSGGTRGPGGGKGCEPQWGMSDRISGSETKGSHHRDAAEQRLPVERRLVHPRSEGPRVEAQASGVGSQGETRVGRSEDTPRGVRTKTEGAPKTPAGQRSAVTVPKKAGPCLREGPCGALSLQRWMSQANASDRGRHNPTAMRHARAGNAGCLTTIRAGPVLAGVRGRGPLRSRRWLPPNSEWAQVAAHPFLGAWEPGSA